MKHYDFAVIGAGSGGLVVATSALRRGAKVALLEKNKIGGECTHAGCIPSKTLLNSARVYQAFKNAASLGLPVIDVAKDLQFARVMEHVDEVVQGIYAHEIPQVWQDMGIDVYVDLTGAQFIDKHHLQIGGEVIESDYTVIATGSSPSPAKKVGTGPLEYLNNENFWHLREMPAAITFLGGGVIAAELGQALARFGSEVTIVDRNPRILKVVDEEVGSLATRIFQEEGMRLITDSEVVACEALEGGKIKLHLEQKSGKGEMFTQRIFV
ncbi:MAG: FAD-dependent oxidoreductase, partial [Lysobacterales bacterium]